MNRTIYPGGWWSRLVGRHAGAQTSYLPTLDGWRAVAIVLVLLSHASDSIQAATGIGMQPVHEVGVIGVRVFFAISGLLITTGLLNEEAKIGSISLGNFYLRRVFRILPPALLVLMVAGALSLAGLIQLGLSRWLSSMFFVSNLESGNQSWYLGHFWSLSIEEQFYLLWPVAFLLLRGRRRLAFAVCLAVALAAWRFVAFKCQLTMTYQMAFMWARRTDYNAIALLWGCIAAMAYADTTMRPWLTRLLRSGWVLLVLLLVGVTTLLPSDGWKVNLAELTLREAVTPFVMIGTIVQANGWLSRLLELGVMRAIGRLSYSVYLWQQFFLVWDDPGRSSALFQSFPANLCWAFLVAVLSFFLVEEPVIAAGRAWVRRRREQQILSPELAS